MASRDETLRRNQHNHSDSNKLNRALPILNLPDTQSPASSLPGPMDTTSPSSKMGPPSRGTPEDNEAPGTRDTSGEIGSNTSSNAVSSTQAGLGQAPKVVQTAFIHKLYK